jgi:hypothetical protein
MSRSIFTALLVLLAAAGAAAQEQPSQTAGWREALTAAVRRATAQNPRVWEAEARIEAARQRVPQAAALPDPEVELGLKDVPVRDLSLSRDNFTMEMVTGRQRLPGRGKRAAQLAAARADVESAAAMRAHEAVDVAADTADAFFQLAATDRGLAILAESRQRLEDAAASATELYKVGKASQSDVLQASLEKTSLDEQLSSLRAERRAQAARFNALQGLPAGAPVPPVGPIAPAGLGAEAPAALRWPGPRVEGRVHGRPESEMGYPLTSSSSGDRCGLASLLRPARAQGSSRTARVPPRAGAAAWATAASSRLVAIGWSSPGGLEHARSGAGPQGLIWSCRPRSPARQGPGGAVAGPLAASWRLPLGRRPPRRPRWRFDGLVVVEVGSLCGRGQVRVRFRHDLDPIMLHGLREEI